MKYKTISPGVVMAALKDRYVPKRGGWLPQYTGKVERDPVEWGLPSTTVGLPVFIPEYVERMCAWLAETSDEELAASTLAIRIEVGSGKNTLLGDVLDIFCYVRGIKKHGN